MSVLEGRQMPEEGVPMQFCPWVHLSQRWEVLERALQQGSLTEEDHATEGLFSQGTHELPEARTSAEIPKESQPKPESTEASESASAWAFPSSSEEQKPQPHIPHQSVQSLPASQQEPESLSRWEKKPQQNPKSHTGCEKKPQQKSESHARCEKKPQQELESLTRCAEKPQQEPESFAKYTKKPQQKPESLTRSEKRR